MNRKSVGFRKIDHFLQNWPVHTGQTVHLRNSLSFESNRNETGPVLIRPTYNYVFFWNFFFTWLIIIYLFGVTIIMSSLVNYWPTHVGLLNPQSRIPSIFGNPIRLILISSSFVWSKSIQSRRCQFPGSLLVNFLISSFRAFLFELNLALFEQP